MKSKLYRLYKCMPFSKSLQKKNYCLKHKTPQLIDEFILYVNANAIHDNNSSKGKYIVEILTISNLK